MQQQRVWAIRDQKSKLGQYLYPTENRKIKRTGSALAFIALARISLDETTFAGPAFFTSFALGAAADFFSFLSVLAIAIKEDVKEGSGGSGGAGAKFDLLPKFPISSLEC